MKSILAILAVLSPLVAFTQEKTFEREYSYKASELDSKASCRSIAINQLRTTLLNEIGVYVESESTLKTTDTNGVFSQNFAERIATLTGGITKLQVLAETWNGETFWMKAAITIDKNSLEQSLKELANDRRKVKELDSLAQQLRDATAELDKLKQALATDNSSSQSTTTSQNSAAQKYNSQIDKLNLVNRWFPTVGSSSLMAINPRSGHIEIKDENQLKEFDYTTQGVYKDHIDYYNKGWDYYSKADYATAYFYFNKAFRFGMFSKVRIKVDDEIMSRKALYAFLSILKIVNADKGDVTNARELVDDKCNPEQKKRAYDEFHAWKKDKKAYWGLKK